MEKSAKSNQSIEKVFRIVEQMAQAKGPLRLQEISALSDIPASTALRMVNTLVELGYAFQEQDTLRYGLTLQWTRIGRQIHNQFSLRDLARPVMEALSQACGEACCLAVEDNSEVLYVETVDGPDKMLRIMQHIGKRAPMHCTGIGKMLLLNRTEEEVVALMQERGMARFTEHTITTPEALLGELEQVRQRRWALDDEECELGARCVASCVMDYTGRIIGGISISGPTTRLTREAAEALAVQVRAAGEELSRLLGWPGTHSLPPEAEH